MDAEAIVARLWPERSPQLEVLGGGLTNHNYKVSFGPAEAYVIRIAGQGTELLGIDRAVEHEAARVAASVGIGPEVVAFVEGCLVTRFVEGEIVPVATMAEPDTMRRVAQALQAVHGGPAISGRFDSFRVVEAYRDVAAGRGGRIPPAFDDALALAREIEQARSAAPERLCHNDLLNANFIDDGSEIRIVDWEYAGMGDVFFDLANFAVNHGLDDDQARVLLEAYFGEVREADERGLVLMRFMSDFREAMWGVVQAVVSDLEGDFDAYAAEHFERLERTAASATFRAALGASV